MTPNEYGEAYQTHLLEQYKLYVEMADRVSQRRDQSNRFYVTIVSALAAIVVVITRFDVPVDGVSSEIVFFAIGLFGFALSVVWQFNIRSYRALNSAKFDIINGMEKQLPYAGYSEEWEILRPPAGRPKYLQLTEEWEILRPPAGRPKYLQLTRVEQFVPAVFMALFITLALYSIWLMFT